MKKITKIVRYLATILVGIGPFAMNTGFGPQIMITGITLMSIEFVQNKQWHLVALNITGVIGWIITLITA